MTRRRDKTDELLDLVEDTADQLRQAVSRLEAAVEANRVESERVANGGGDDAGADDG